MKFLDHKGDTNGEDMATVSKFPSKGCGKGIVWFEEGKRADLGIEILQYC